MPEKAARKDASEERRPEVPPFVRSAVQEGQSEPAENDDEALQARVRKIRRDYWQPYPRAKQALAEFNEIFDHPPVNRPLSKLVIGPANNGKTMLARHFAKEINKAHSYEDEERTYRAAVYIQMPPEPDTGMMEGLILREINAPATRFHTKTKRFNYFLDAFPKSQARILLIDELHNILGSRINTQHALLAQIRYMSNQFEMPVIAFGLPEAEALVQTDQQLGSRLETFELPKWQLDKDFGVLVSKMLFRNGMLEKGKGASEKVITLIYAMSGGLIGETKKIITRASIHALRTDRTDVDIDILEKIDWLSPKERRRRGDGRPDGN